MNEIIDRYYNDTKDLVLKINSYTCEICGGSLHNHNCEYCDCENKNIEIDIKKLELILQNFIRESNSFDEKHIGINKFFNLLFILNNKVDLVKTFLKKYNYKNSFEMYSEEMISRLKTQDVSELDINTLETIIYQKNNNYDLMVIYQLCIQRCLSKDKNIDLQCFQEMIKQLTEKVLSPFYRNAKCILQQYKDKEQDGKYLKISGENSGNKVYLNINEINNLYYYQDSNILIALFHEATHGAQFKNIFYGNQDIDPLVFLEIEDYILSKYLPNYYTDNYHNISFEIEAEYYGYTIASQYINSDIMPEEIIRRYKNILNKKRIINGQEQNIDSIFNAFIFNHPELLKKYPQLQFLFKIKDNKVISLDEQELLNKYQVLLSNTNLSVEQRRKYELFFSQYIDIDNTQKNSTI